MTADSEDEESVDLEASNQSVPLGSLLFVTFLWVQCNLGFVREAHQEFALLRHQFRSKVGGRPVSMSKQLLQPNSEAIT